MTTDMAITQVIGTLGFRKISSRLIKAASFLVAACVLTAGQSAPAVRPDVRLDADGLAPRQIEDLTGTAIVRSYASAWREMESAFASNQAGRVQEEFVGFAKDRLMRRIGEQRQAGVHVRIVDRGHQLKAVFYSTDGASMQLLDRAQLEIQTFDGNTLLDTQNAPHEYIVLMTPGADRWYVRDLEEVSEKSF
jgi:hypothetical protein